MSLGYRLMAQTGYPWTLDLHVLYDLSADGLTVTQTATNMSASAAPYAQGAHPYLRAESDPIDRLELLLPAATRLRVDDRLLPTGREPVEGYGRTTSGCRGRSGRPCWTTRSPTSPADDDGARHRRAARPGHRARRRAVGRRAAPLAAGVQRRRGARRRARRSLAVEPMTAPADAFRSGDDLITLAPAGEAGDELSASWGIRALV